MAEIVYTLDDYLWMLADDARVKAYAAAIHAVVRPGDRVIEIGAGLGFFSVLAARAGAARVDAIDANPIVHLARRVADANGVGDRVHVHQVAAEQFSPAQRADAIIADLRGPTPMARRGLLTLIDARDRMLRAGGSMIGRRDTLRCAPTRCPDVFRTEVAAPLGRREVCLDPVARVAFDTPLRCPVGPRDLLADPVTWAAIDYHTLETPHVAGSASWTFDAAAEIDGLAVWFDANLADGVHLSAAPSGERHVYDQIFIPFRIPARVGRGDTLRVALGTHLVGDEYVWTWQAWIASGGSERLAVAQNSLAERVLDPVLLVEARYNRHI